MNQIVPYSLVNSYLHFGETHVVTYPEERGSMFLLNVGVNVPTYRASQLKDRNVENGKRKIEEKISRIRGHRQLRKRKNDTSGATEERR
jgi:D-tyrosyl-tRNA(Tyr) deacylase